MNKGMNRKGFTLVELLATIAIVGLVLGLSTYGVISYVKASKEKAKEISIETIKESASIYAGEANSTDWKNITNEEYNYFCVTIQELINKGLVKEKEIKNVLEKEDDKFNYVAVMKNKVTSTIEKEEIITSVIDNNIFKICSGSIVNEVVNKIPILKTGTSYTDEVDVTFDPAVFNDESIDEEGNKIVPKITGNECYYGITSSNLNIKGEVAGTTCKINSDDGELKSNTNYYVKVCTMTEKESYVCSNTYGYKTKDLVSPSITIGNNITIKYTDTGIKGGGSHYFKSTLDATASKTVTTCDNNFNCSTTTTSIKKDTWYKVDSTEIGLSYTGTGNGKVNAIIKDRSGNSKESSKEFTLREITFYKGYADTINNQNNDIKYTCIAEKGGKCKITSPSIERSGYEALGWNTSSSAITSSWGKQTEKEIASDASYYPITRKKVTITFNSNGATSIGSSSLSCYMYNTNTSCGVTAPSITRSGYNIKGWNTSSSATSSSWNIGIEGKFSSNQTYYAITSKTVTITFNGNGYLSANSTKSCTINNSATSCAITAPSVSRSGYNFVGWNTSSSATSSGWNAGVKGRFSSNNTYYAIWKSNTYTITYDNNGGSGCSTKNVTYNSQIGTLCTPTRTGYTFIGWFNSNYKDSPLNYYADTYSDLKSAFGYDANSLYNHYLSYGKNEGRRISQYIATDKYTTASNKTIYAGWKANTYTATMNANGGTNGSDYSATWTATYGNNYNLDSYIPTRSGYTFKGWYSASSGGTKFSGTWTWTALNNFTFYAHWEQNVTNINANRYSCATYSDYNRLAVFYVTTCVNSSCTYTKFNGLGSGSDFSRDVLKDSINWSLDLNTVSSSPSSNCRSTWYVNASNGLNCRTGVSTSNTSIVTAFANCTQLNIYRTTTKYDSSGNNWFYDVTNDCYLSGAYVSSSNPCGSSGGGSTGGTCAAGIYCVGPPTTCSGTSNVTNITSSAYLPANCSCRKTTEGSGYELYSCS